MVEAVHASDVVERVWELRQNGGWKAAVTRPLESGRHVAQPFQAAGYWGFPAPSLRFFADLLRELRRYTSILVVPILWLNSAVAGVASKSVWRFWRRSKLVGA